MAIVRLQAWNGSVEACAPVVSLAVRGIYVGGKMRMCLPELTKTLDDL